jgi:hypothetical protein
LVEEDRGLIGGKKISGPGPKGGPCRLEYTGSGDEAMSASARHPTALLEERGQGGVTQSAGPAAIVERVETPEAFGLEQTGNHFQFDQVVGQLLHIDVIDRFDDPLLERRSKGAHVLSPNIRSTLQGAWDEKFYQSLLHLGVLGW